MVGELITLPLRVGVRVTQLWLRAAGEATGLALNLASSVLDRDRREVRSGTSPAERPVQRRPRTATDAADGSPASSAQTLTVPPEQEIPLPPLRDEPVHVSEEPELVEEFSEPGAEDGAGAEIHVQEPWDGYEKCSAKEVIARLAAASPAGLAAVQLYESRHRSRQTILAAVERELRSANGSGSPTPERNR